MIYNCNSQILDFGFKNYIIVKVHLIKFHLIKLKAHKIIK